MFKKFIAVFVILTIVTAIQAEITANLVVYDVGPLIETGDEFVTYRLVVALSETDDWTSAQISASLTDAEFYQDAYNDGNPPDPTAFGDYPDSEYTTYYTCPADYPNAAYTGGIVGFNTGPTETSTTLDANWFDTIASIDGTYVIAQITILPDSTSWTGQVDLTAYSANNPGGYSESYSISAADYEPVVTATYIGPDEGSYNDPNNWDVGAVPLNIGLSRYNVIIPNSTAVNYDVTSDSEISGLSLGSDSTLSLGLDEELLVRGTGVIGGIVEASGSGASFQAPSRFATFSGTRARVNVSDGANVYIAAPAYTLNMGDYRQHLNILSAEGAGSLLDLSQLDSISVPISVSYTYVYSIAGTNEGIVDFSGVTSLTGANTSSDEWLQILIASGGDIRFPSLAQVDGRTWFNIDVPEYTLPALEAMTATHMDTTDAVTVNLPTLGTFDSGTLTVPNGGTVNADQMVNFTSSTMAINDGGTVNAPVLTNVSSSAISLNPSRTLNAPAFTNIENARLAVDGGAVLTVADDHYYLNLGDWREHLTILSANGAGSLLDLTSIGSISVPISVSYTYVYSIAATDHGVIDASNATTITGANMNSNEWLKFLIGTDSELRLDSVAQVDGRTWFDIDVPAYEFPELTETNGTISFDLAAGTSLQLPQLQRTVGSANELIIPVFAVFEAPVLTEIDKATIELEVGGTLDAPNLTTFTNSTFLISQVSQGSPFLNVPEFTNIDHSRLFVDGGATFRVAAPSYTFNWGDYRDHLTLLSADGTDSLLDMSSVTSFSVPISVSYAYTYSVTSTNNGVIDLSNVASITGANPNSNEWVRFSTDSGGRILFGDVLVSGGRTYFEIDGTNSGLEFAGGLHMETPSMLYATTAANVQIAGDFSFNHTNEADFATGAGTLHMNGAGSQLLEVGGEDIGVPEGAVSGNFEFGQLIVGQSDQTTIVKLVDQLDNGNRGDAGVEALYLQGFAGSENGLRILGGSTLVIENIQVYAQESDEWVEINSLFPAGVNQIPYDDGFIALSIVVNDCNGNGIDDHVDILLGYAEDCNENDVPDDCDIADETSNDVNENGIPDECEDCDENEIPDYLDLQNCDGSPWCSDCNYNDILDVCDVAEGTSNDVNLNGIPDECEGDCNGNGVPDEYDIAIGTSADCQPNGVPDECDLDPNDPDGNGSVSNDVNGNDLPDECETDCNDNNVPDDWDLYLGTSADCNENLIPDECDIADGTSEDDDNDGVPDECEPDCNENGLPDDWDIAIGVSEDCNENEVPDECDIESGASIDSDGNGVPDECEDCNENGVLDYVDILEGTSVDCNGNRIPDECEDAFEVYYWIGPDGGLFSDPANWDLGDIPHGEADLYNTGDFHNTCVLDSPGDTTVCSLTLRSDQYWQMLEIRDGSMLNSTGGTTLDDKSWLELYGGGIGGGLIVNDGTIRGYGELNATVENGGMLLSDAGGDLLISGESFINQPGGLLRASFGTLLNIQTDTFTQQGTIEVQSAAALLVDWSIVNEAGGRIELTGGALGAEDLDNSNEGEVAGFGTIQAAFTVNNLGDMTFGADTQIIGQQIVNYGTIAIQSGTLSFFGPLLNNGVIIGDYTGGFHPLAGEGIFVHDDFQARAAAAILMPAPDTALRIGGNCDIAIDDNTAFNMVAAELRMTGTSGVQTLEVMSRDIGRNPRGLDPTVAGRYPLGTLRIGPTATTVELIDANDNDGLGQDAYEALYVNRLQIDADAVLVNPACRIYYNERIGYGSVTNPENLIRLAMYGDLNDDGSVNLTDLASLLGNYGETSGMSYDDGDLDGDGDIDIADLAELLGVYGDSAE